MDEELFSQENEYEEFVAINNQSPPPEAEIPQSSQRRRFQVSAPYNVQLRHSILQPDNLQQQDTVTQGIKEILRNQKVLMTRMDDIEKTLKENVIDKGLLLAQTHTLRECKVVLAKVHHSIGRLVGEIENPMQIEIASRLPICTLDAALDFEDKLNSKEFADETRRAYDKVMVNLYANKKDRQLTRIQSMR
ncbi:uncharacterized protein LOC126752300 [Bactrocera neohumeralis]|uniref:uncharacterized protein LOC126752300 n=1 Tax=Bactrocera neohumeralis TaxID=98809 RepID=UPI0021659368|nr:uncharacterized protein LOC126752300 [Bactrocera neohumeralis]